MSTEGRRNDSAHDFVFGWSSPFEDGPDLFMRLYATRGMPNVLKELEDLLEFWWQDGWQAGAESMEELTIDRLLENDT